MPVDGINNNVTTMSNTSTSSSSATNDLDKNAFLKLLIAQLSNQDPLNPMEDREFIAQMAQFSTLEEMQNMNKTLESMSEANRFSAVGYIGKAVAFNTVTTDEDGTEVNTPTVGVVRAVWFDATNGTILDTDAGQIELSKVTGVADAE